LTERIKTTKGISDRQSVDEYEKTHSIVSADVQKKLEQELKKLKTLLEFGEELRVVWSPKVDSVLSGEVHGNLIYIYEADLFKALKTLRHEFVDYCVSGAIQPYKEIANLLIKKINTDAYDRKEKIVETLAKLLDETKVEDTGRGM
jgi:6-phosphogluconate dehydrogenase (decarboxylating)